MSKKITITISITIDAGDCEVVVNPNQGIATASIEDDEPTTDGEGDTNKDPEGNKENTGTTDNKENSGRPGTGTGVSGPIRPEDDDPNNN